MSQPNLFDGRRPVRAAVLLGSLKRLAERREQVLDANDFDALDPQRQREICMEDYYLGLATRPSPSQRRPTPQEALRLIRNSRKDERRHSATNDAQDHLPQPLMWYVRVMDDGAPETEIAHLTGWIVLKALASFWGAFVILNTIRAAALGYAHPLAARQQGAHRASRCAQNERCRVPRFGLWPRLESSSRPRGRSVPPQAVGMATGTATDRCR